jgi:hypothetical protein
VRGSPGPCEIVASCKVFCVSVPKCCFNVLELLALDLSCSGPIPESLYLSSQSDVPHLFKSLVNHSSGFVGRLKDLEVVIPKRMAVVEGRAWFRFCVEVAAVEWFVVAHCSFDMWVLSDEAVPYPVACLGRLVFAFVDDEDLGHSGVSSVQVERHPRSFMICSSFSPCAISTSSVDMPSSVVVGVGPP